MHMSTQLESTATLLVKAKSGDDSARDRLCSIYIPILTKWAHGRLPVYARDLSETDDLVQSSLINALNKLDSFVPEHEGAFLAYLRKILLNNIRMELRRISNKKDKAEYDGKSSQSEQSTALDVAIGSEMVENYEQALTKMSKAARETVILRVEFGYSYPEIAVAMNYQSANAARMMCSRALTSLAERMQ